MSNNTQQSTVKKATVIGGGAFGSALGMVMARKGATVVVWVRDPQQAALVNATRENTRYLPGIPLPPSMSWSHEVSEAVLGTEIVLLAIPTQFLRGISSS